jgi:hypothetical protein
MRGGDGGGAQLNPIHTARRNEDRCRPRPGRSAIALAPAEPIGTSSAPIRSATADGFACGAGAADHHAEAFAVPAARPQAGQCATRAPRPGSATAPSVGHAIDRKRDMHRPVSAFLAIFARAIDRIDNPDALLDRRSSVVLFLSDSSPSSGRCSRRAWNEELVGGRIACLAQRLAASTQATGPLARTSSRIRVPRHQSARCAASSAIAHGVMLPGMARSGRARTMFDDQLGRVVPASSRWCRSGFRIDRALHRGCRSR